MNGNYLTNISILYRNTQKFFDKVLSQYDIGSGQLLFLFFINEHEGITMQELSQNGEVDKGTTTKSVQRLIEQGYVQARTDENDRRIKRLYTTEKVSEVMKTLYEYRKELRTGLSAGVDFETFETLLGKIVENSRAYSEPEERYPKIRIAGLQKMTLLDYPGKVAAVIFTSGCNFKCPYCHNRDLVFVPDNYEFYQPEEVLSYLEKRKGILDGVCISGGEPLIQENLEEFIAEIKNLGYLVKLDTNGNRPERLKQLCESGMVDYVAVDVKNSPEKYAQTVGLNNEVFRLENIKESVAYLMASDVDYEFRTTVAKELHDKEDLLEVARWIRGAKHYYLQQYTESPNVIQPGFHAYDNEEMKQLCEAVREFVPSAELRGLKEG